MRQHFLVLQQARNRVMELAAEIEGCMGDTLDGGRRSAAIKEEAPTSTPCSIRRARRRPAREIDRPGEASPYR